MNRLLLILACVFNTLFRYSPFSFQFGPPEENHTSYAVGQAISYLLLLWYSYNKNIARRNLCLYWAVIWFGVSNLMDELFFNPLELGLNELAFALFIIITETYIYFKNGPQATQ